MISDRSEGGSNNGNGGHDGGGVEAHGGVLGGASRDGELEGTGVLGISEEDGVVGSWVAGVGSGNVAPGFSAPVDAVVGLTLLAGWVLDIPGLACGSVIGWVSLIGEGGSWWHTVFFGLEAIALGVDGGDGKKGKGGSHLCFLINNYKKHVSISFL